MPLHSHVVRQQARRLTYDVESAAGMDVKAIARRATECYLTQVLTHGFLHSDPHPGNIAIDARGTPQPDQQDQQYCHVSAWQHTARGESGRGAIKDAKRMQQRGSGD